MFFINGEEFDIIEAGGSCCFSNTKCPCIVPC